MKRYVIGAFLGLVAIGTGAFFRFHSPHVEGYYSAFCARDGRVVHMVMSDNGTPADMDDDWIVDWEYR